MKSTNNKLNGDQVISEDLDFHGLIVGKTTVNANVFFVLHGMITGDLVLLEDSKVNLHGMVNGNVINNGGILQIFGTIDGDLIRRGGNTTIDPKSEIHGNII